MSAPSVAAAAAATKTVTSAAVAAGGPVTKKLRGWAWFKSIGSPKYIVAPMVAQSELPFRLLCRELGAQLCFTPMIHSRVWLDNSKYRAEHLQTCDADRPLVAQICGHEPDVLLNAALTMQHKCDAIDLNLGCPQGIARRGRYGAFLLTETDLLVEIVRKLDAGLDVPVTCKIRLLPSIDDTIALCKALEAAGASMITVHGRTKENKGHHITSCDWDAIRQIREVISVPVVANGGIGCLADVERCLEATGCAGVMSSEGVLENPAMFVNNIHPKTGQVVTNWDITRRYFELLRDYPAPAIKCIISHSFKFLHNEWADNVDLRAKLGSMSKSPETLRELCEELISRAEAKGLSAPLPVQFHLENTAVAASSGSGAGAGAGNGAGAGASTPADVCADNHIVPQGCPATVEEYATALADWKSAFSANVAKQSSLGLPTGGTWYMRHRIPRPKQPKGSAANVDREKRKRDQQEAKAKKRARRQARREAKAAEVATSESKQ